MGENATGRLTTYYVAECMEFNRYGEYREDIHSAEEAVKIYQSIPSERLNAGKGIGLHVEEEDGIPLEFSLVYNGELDVDQKFYFKNGIPYVVNTFSNAQLLLYEMEEKLYFDIYLLDIEMPGINGLSLAEKIRSMDDAGYIVFITSHLKFLINGYDYFAYQFIPKNNLKKKLISTLESLQKRLDIEEEKFYQICTNHRYEKILYKDIYYVYKDEKYAIFVTQNGNIPIRETLKNIYKDLEQKEFIFIDRGYIVNVVHIMSLYKNTIYLRNSKNLKISRTYTEEVKKRIHTYWKEHTTNGRDIHT